VARYVIDAATLLHLVDAGLHVDPGHQSRRTAWQIARQYDWDTLRDAEYLAVTRLQADALVTVDPGLAATARDTVAVAAIEDLLAPG
jgi:predicted nucleic acid-binding protein